jgi:hypothetical protein
MTFEWTGATSARWAGMRRAWLESTIFSSRVVEAIAVQRQISGRSMSSIANRQEKRQKHVETSWFP